MAYNVSLTHCLRANNGLGSLCGPIYNGSDLAFFNRFRCPTRDMGVNVWALGTAVPLQENIRPSLLVRKVFLLVWSTYVPAWQLMA